MVAVGAAAVTTQADIAGHREAVRVAQHMTDAATLGVAGSAGERQMKHQTVPQAGSKRGEAW